MVVEAATAAVGAGYVPVSMRIGITVVMGSAGGQRQGRGSHQGMQDQFGRFHSDSLIGGFSQRIRMGLGGWLYGLEPRLWGPHGVSV